jgi:hypothetical protein
VHQGLVGEGADAEGGGQLGAVLQGHPLLRVVGVEAVLGASAQAGAALAADRAPVEDHEVAGGDPGDALADLLDDAGALVAADDRQPDGGVAGSDVVIGVAQAGRHDLDTDLVRLRLVELQVDDFPADMRGPGDRGARGDAHLLRSLPSARGR